MSKTSPQGTPREGRAGAYVWYKRDGEELMRIATNNVSKRKATRLELKTRLTVKNPGRLWSKFDKQDRPAFEDRKPGQTGCSLFEKVNFTIEPVFLPKALFDAGGCVLTHAQISDGSLPTIKQTLDDDKVLSDIAVGDLQLTASTTVGQLSAAVLNNNPLRFQEGDTLLCYIGRQRINIETKAPEVAITINKVKLQPSNPVILASALIPGNGFEIVDRHLAFTAPSLTLGTYLHTRPFPDNTQRCYLSPQTFVGDNPIIAQFTGDEAFERSAESYGGYRKDPPNSPSQPTAALPHYTGATPNGPETDTGNTGPTNPGGSTGGGTNTPTNPPTGGGDGEDGFSR